MPKTKEKDECIKEPSPRATKRLEELKRSIYHSDSKFALHKESKNSVNPKQSKSRPPLISTTRTSFRPEDDSNNKNG